MNFTGNLTAFERYIKYRQGKNSGKLIYCGTQRKSAREVHSTQYTRQYHSYSQPFSFHER